MGFMKPKAPAPTPVPTSPIPTAEPLTAQQQAVQKTVQEQEADATLKKKKQLKAGKSSLTVGLDSTSGVNVGTPEKQAGLSVGGA